MIPARSYDLLLALVWLSCARELRCAKEEIEGPEELLK